MGRAAKRREERVGDGDDAKDIGFVGAPEDVHAVFVTGVPMSSEMPALLTRTSSSETEAAALAIVSASVTSNNSGRPPIWPATSAPRSASRAPTRTLYPFSASCRAMCNPIPLVAPVTRAVDAVMRSCWHRGRCRFPAVVITLCVLLSAVPGRETSLARYEDHVLALLGQHSGRLVARIRSADGPWSEVHLIEFESEHGLETFQQDPRRLALSALRDESIASTTVIRGERVD
jgi:hypothetical protein